MPLQKEPETVLPDALPMSDGGLKFLLKSLQLFGGIAAVCFGFRLIIGARGATINVDDIIPGCILAIFGLTAAAAQILGLGFTPYFIWIGQYWKRNVAGYRAVFHFCEANEVCFKIFPPGPRLIAQHADCTHCASNNKRAVEFETQLGGWRRDPGSISYHRRAWILFQNNCWRVDYTRRWFKNERLTQHGWQITDPNGVVRMYEVGTILRQFYDVIFHDDFLGYNWFGFDAAVIRCASERNRLRMQGERLVDCATQAIEAFDGNTRMSLSDGGEAFRPHLIQLYHLLFPDTDISRRLRYDESPKARRIRERESRSCSAVRQCIVAVHDSGSSQMPPSDDDGSGNYR